MYFVGRPSPASALAVFAGLAGLCLAGRAAAADLAPLEAYDSQTVSVAIYDWTGFYGGAPLGASSRPVSPAVAPASDVSPTGSIRTGSRKPLDSLGPGRIWAGFAANPSFVYSTGDFGFGKLAYCDALTQDERWVLRISADARLSRSWPEPRGAATASTARRSRPRAPPR